MWANGWQKDAALALRTSFREHVLLPAIRPSDRALLRSQAGPHAGAWLAAIPADPATTLAPDIMHLALRRRLRLPLPLTRARCGREGAPGCRALVDNVGDHALACQRTGLLARRGLVLERAWIQVVREAIGPEGRVVPQQWLANTTAPGVAADDRRRLDFVIHDAAALGEGLCCDATFVSPVRRDGSPQAGAPERDGVAIATAQRHKLARYPELTRGGPHRLCVLVAEAGGAGTTNPSAWCSASLHCVRAVPLPRCAPRPHRDGQGAGGVAWQLRSSERHAALSPESGQCLRCPQQKTTCR